MERAKTRAVHIGLVVAMVLAVATAGLAPTLLAASPAHAAQAHPTPTYAECIKADIVVDGPVVDWPTFRGEFDTEAAVTGLIGVAVCGAIGVVGGGWAGAACGAAVVVGSAWTTPAYSSGYNYNMGWQAPVCPGGSSFCDR